jgi:hypothetical protein
VHERPRLHVDRLCAVRVLAAGLGTPGVVLIVVGTEVAGGSY